MLNLFKTRNKILVFWGLMDLLALALYFWSSALRGNIPFYADVVDFYQTFSAFGASEGPGAAIQIFFFVGLLMKISLVYSAYLFLFKDKLNFILLGIQEVLRFASLTSSVSLLPLLLNLTGSHSAVLALSGFLLSECCKVGSLWWYHKRVAA
ncbi:hypothetical protein C3432_17745 [Citrobacter amalonaticus]|uniref:Uncharacterized protein n=1 Tax=Citrobacter amalonaticus TaxID=35703 RepID=A0A2S4RTM5_CITAM|nr:hypothetical protein [Citrobacter amalonaticus]POT57197.1 hypothetical protein C3432_17745 [Citrobacter amalonaticus]POT72514.1 hypothetical protein C3436_20140 [Citrobacter amalonaticus]POU63369.1 hypothetical protein C3430_18395 [Citrobacter amalonaticus]POV03133.1 hypothetical protein C3424_21310 [Citrobacter amalonaticus]